jgi:hypothetical protein
MPKKAKLLPYEFKLSDCEASLNLIESTDDPGFGVAFLNIKFPDGRWIAFKSVEGMRVVMYEKPKTEPLASDGNKETKKADP